MLSAMQAEDDRVIVPPNLPRTGYSDEGSANGNAQGAISLVVRRGASSHRCCLSGSGGQPSSLAWSGPADEFGWWAVPADELVSQRAIVRRVDLDADCAEYRLLDRLVFGVGPS